MENNNFIKIIEPKKYRIIYFTADWCSYCKPVKNSINKILNKYKNISLISVNTDIDIDITKYYKVQSVPTIIFLIFGKEVKRLVGYVDENKLKNYFTKIIK